MGREVPPMTNAARTPILSESLIHQLMQQARVLGCPPTGRRCSSVPRRVDMALQTLDAHGWCRIGSLTDVRSHGPSWDVIFQVDRGELRLERLP